MKIIQAQDKLILRAVSPDGDTTSGDLLVAFAENGGSTGVRISNLEVETQTVLNSTTTTLEDSFLEINRNNSTADGEDAGIFFNRGSIDHALFYWDASDDNFVAGTTTHEATVTAISNITLGQIKVATTPTNANHAASKSYVDARTITVSSDDSSAITVDLSGDTELVFTGGTSITTDTTAGGNAVNISVDAAMTGINSITSGSGENLTLTAQTNLVKVDDILTFNSEIGDPSAAAVTKLYAISPGLGGTGLSIIHSGIGGGNPSELMALDANILKIFGDDSTTMEVEIPEQEFHIKGGNGITTSTSSTQTLTISLDSQLLTVNELSSTDSTGITIKDDLLLAGTLRAEDSTTISVDGALGVSGAIASGAITSSGVVTGTGFTIGSAAINETELETIDGVTAGTVAASKAVVVDANKDAASFRNITATGTVTTAILDVNSIQSTDSTAVRINEGLDVIGTLQVNDISGIDSSAIQVNEAINLNGAVQVNSTVTSTGNITTLGSFVIGSASMDETDLEKLDGITNGAGAANKAVVLDANADIASGLRNITTSGTITSNAGVVVDNITIDGTEIDLSTGDLTLDIEGDLIIDANGADIKLQDDGTEFGRISRVSSDLVVKSMGNNNDILFKGLDDTATITALQLDMSEAGNATFNGAITHPGATIMTPVDDLATSTTALSLTATVHSLAVGEGDYTLAAGSEGQIMHFVIAGGDSVVGNVANTKITISQVRDPDDGDVLATYVWSPFIGNQAGDSTTPKRTLATCVFANGAWNLDQYNDIT